MGETTLLMFTVASGTAAAFTANISSQLTDPGTLAVVAIAAGIPLAFYVIKKLIGLLPKR